jgi:hypothetical protein
MHMGASFLICFFLEIKPFKFELFYPRRLIFFDQTESNSERGRFVVVEFSFDRFSNSNYFLANL